MTVPDLKKISSLLFNNKISVSQTDGINTIVNEWNVSGLTDVRWLAYMLATTYHETAKTMQPITEYGSKAYLQSKKYYPYIGRGYVQLTWDYNYKKMGSILGVDLYNHPELALDKVIATKIMFEGMTTGKTFKGDFTGKHLGNYFSKTVDDPKNARKIINGLDKAELISTYHNKFLLALG